MAAWPRLARSTVLCQNPQRHRLPKTIHQRQDPLSVARGAIYRPANRGRQGAHCGRALEAWAALKGVHRGSQADMGGLARSRGSDAR